MTTLPDMMTPQVSLRTMTVNTPEGGQRDIMMMVIETAVTHYEFMLCDGDTYRETARKIADGITTVGAQMRKSSKLIEVKGGLPDAFNPGKRNGRG